MSWTPLTEDELSTMIADSVGVMEPPASSLWHSIRVRPVKWQLRPWGDVGGGFWVVGILVTTLFGTTISRAASTLVDSKRQG